MAFDGPLTIIEAVHGIAKNKFILPAIQREFVWQPDQIELLFDSIMRDYPIGSLLFWSVEKNVASNFQFYEFLRDYHARDNTHNQRADVAHFESTTAILDGQQRLTSLYIGLCGTYAYKMPWKHRDNDSAYPKRRLYLNLLSRAADSEYEYDFQFLTDEEAKKESDKDTIHWFLVNEVMAFKSSSMPNEYLEEKGLNSLSKEKKNFASETIFKLWEVIHKDTLIKFFLEKDESLDKVLNVFIRVNSGGTKLTHSDLLLSIATAQWQERDESAREIITEFVDDLNRVGEGFDLNKDFVLKSCLVLSDSIKDFAFKVDNFNSENMREIEKKWDDVSGAIKEAVTLVSRFGFQRDTLHSAYPLIPIAYYLWIAKPNNFLTAQEYQQERNKIFKWLLMVLLKKTFTGQPDSVLRPMRSDIREHYASGFPLNQISESLKGKPKSITFTEDEIYNLLSQQYGKPYTFSSLAVVYPTLDFSNKFHQDHIFPKRLFSTAELLKHGIPEDKIEFYRTHFNSLANLQLLEGVTNEEKAGRPFEDWLNETFKSPQERDNYMRKHFIPPGIDLSLDGFEGFITGRGKLLVEEFTRLLKI